VIAPLLGEIANFGNATVRRIYGDWTTPNLQSWKQVLAEHSIVPIRQSRDTSGKCDRFVFTNVLTGSGAGDAAKSKPLKTGWANPGEICSRIVKQEPDFDARNYGFSKLRSMIEEIDLFQLEERPGPQGHKHLWLRDKRKKAST
jgi:OST-HTH/LOTUS domain